VAELLRAARRRPGLRPCSLAAVLGTIWNVKLLSVLWVSMVLIWNANYFVQKFDRFSKVTAEVKNDITSFDSVSGCKVFFFTLRNEIVTILCSLHHKVHS
jgi:hypothetical protein